MTIGKIASNLATAVLVACAVTVTALAARRELAPPPPAAAPALQPRALTDAEWAAATSAGQRMGPSNAPVQIVEFSDFQCPFCARAQTALQNLRRRYPDRVSVVYRHFPLESIHPHAVTAAVASDCAAAQGRFEPFHLLLFAHQDSVGVKAWDRFAAEAGVPDPQAFRACMAAARTDRIHRDTEAGRRLGVRVTPTFLVNGQMLHGAVSEAELERWMGAAAR